MFKRRAIKKYENKLLPKLQKRYGKSTYYSASQVRATVYQCNFSATYLPLGYILFLESSKLNDVISTEFPELCIHNFQDEMKGYLDDSNYDGSLQQLNT